MMSAGSQSELAQKPLLLSVVELGGYPDFSPLYAQAGFQVLQTDSIRKAVKLIRRYQPRVLLAEFNFQSDFRDRTSSLETLMSCTQGGSECAVIVFYEKEFEAQYQRFLQHASVHASLAFPVDEQALKAILQEIARKEY